jgi:hypothetical protein
VGRGGIMRAGGIHGILYATPKTCWSCVYLLVISCAVCPITHSPVKENTIGNFPLLHFFTTFYVYLLDTSLIVYPTIHPEVKENTIEKIPHLHFATFLFLLSSSAFNATYNPTSQ